MVEAVEYFILHPTSMSYMNKVFEHQKDFWRGIWQYTHTVTTTNNSPNLGELTEIKDDVNIVTMPLRYGWDCRTFQMGHPYHTYIRYLSTFNWYAGLYGSTRTRYHHRRIPQFGRIIAEILDDVSLEMISLCFGWDRRTFQTASHIHVIHIYSVWTP